MIRYQISEPELLAAINHAGPTWIRRAQDRTDTYKAKGRYVTPPTDIWSEIKRVYMNLQGYKCAFCERRLERSDFGNIEHDVEHFRPKSMVKEWTPRTATGRSELTFDLGSGSARGYYLLPHHHDNYVISCKTCNTAFKGNGFPVDGARDIDMATPRSAAEQAWLVYPIGDFDDDPQHLIRFDGIVPVPAAGSTRQRRRAQVIIEFFGLAERDGLLLERSITLLALHLALDNVAHHTSLTDDIARHMVATLTADHAAHANCARSFVALWADDEPAARTFSEAALAHVTSAL